MCKPSYELEVMKLSTVSKPVTNMSGIHVVDSQMGYYRMSNELLNPK